MPQTARAESFVDGDMRQEDEGDGQGKDERILDKEVSPVRIGEVGVGSRDAVWTVVVGSIVRTDGVARSIEDVVRQYLAIYSQSVWKQRYKTSRSMRCCEHL